MNPFTEDLLAGARAAESILERLGAPVEKAVSPLSSLGFGRLLRELMAKLRPIAQNADRAAVLAALERLDVNWPEMTESARNRVIAAAAAAIARQASVVAIPAIRELALAAENVVVLTKRASIRQFGVRIVPSFDKLDRRIVDFASSSQGNYITTRYGAVADGFTEKVRQIVASGMEQGYGRKEIGRLLADAVKGPMIRSSEAYWESVASIHIGRARSWGQLSAFAQAEIAAYQWNSVMDEVTTEACRFLHGRRFEVAPAVQSFLDVETSEDPKAVENLQPWVRQGKDDSGRKFLFVERNGQRTHVADIDEAGFGAVDKPGKYSGVHKDLSSLGIQSPPAHPRCRSVLDPILR